MAKEIVLRDYQKALISGFYQEIHAGNPRTLAVAVMGAGKTITACSIIRDCVNRGKKAVFLVHLNCLVSQTVKTLASLGVRSTVIQGDKPFDPTAPAIVAMLPTVGRRLSSGISPQELFALSGDLLNPPKELGLVVLDEAHATAWMDAYVALDRHFPHVPFLGLTATPWRLSKKEWLGQKYQQALVPLQPPEVIANGGAVPCRTFTVGGVFDLDEIGTGANGDYADGEMAKQAEDPAALAFVVSQYKKLCWGEKFMMVGATVAQALATESALKEAGIPCESVVGDVDPEEREAIFARVRSGESWGICSVGCLTAGFDMPCLTSILYVRATKSKALFHQVAGRGSRPFAGKTHYKLLDFGGNVPRLGNPMGYQDYEIHKAPPKEHPAPTKTCPQCELEILAFAQVCPHCGYLFPKKEQQELFIPQELGEWFSKDQKKQVKFLRKKRQEAWKERGNPDAPSEAFHREHGFIPPAEWAHNACLGKRSSSATRYQFLEWLRRKAPQRNGDRWLRHHLALEFGEKMPQLSPWWDVLGVSQHASLEECQISYRNRLASAVELYPPHYLESLGIELNGALAAAQESSLFGAKAA